MKSTILFILCNLITIFSFAQQTCVIQGKFTTDSLRWSKATVQKVYLSREDNNGKLVAVDSCLVKDHAYSFTSTFDGPVMMYFITGFDNGVIPFMRDNGTVVINGSASFPNGSTVVGTDNNRILQEYMNLPKSFMNEQLATINSWNNKPAGWRDSEDGKLAAEHLNAVANAKYLAKLIEFVIQNDKSPVSLLVIQKDLMRYMSSDMLKRFFKDGIRPALKDHPYAIELENQILAQSMKMGDEVPDFTMKTNDGKMMSLKDLRGKYVLIDFWASWCGPCKQEMPKLIELYEKTKGNTNFTILSYSVDEKEADWKQALKDNNMIHPGWVQASIASEQQKTSVSKLYGFSSIPHTVLIDPEGRLITTGLRGDEMIHNISRILSGDLYYMQQNQQQSGMKMMELKK